MEFATNDRKQWTTTSQDVLNVSKQSTYKDIIRQQHTSNGQYASTMTSKCKINITNMSHRLSNSKQRSDYTLGHASPVRQSD